MLLLVLAAITGGDLAELSAQVDTRTIEASVGERLVIESRLTIPAGYSVGIRDWDLEKPADGQEFDSGQRFGVWAKPRAESYRLEHEVYIRRTEEVETKDGRTVTVVVAGTERKLTEVVWIKITGDLPPPIPSPPPGPAPPRPTKAPFRSPSGLAFLILKEASETGRLPVEQRAIFNSSRILRFGQEHAAKIGGDSFFRIWDDDYSDDDLANVGQHLREAYKATKAAAKSLPWIVVVNGDRGHSGPLPATIDKTLRLLEQYR